VPLAQAQDHALTRLRLTLRNYIIDCSRERSSILIGRDYRCGLVMSDQMASRKHCTIELRGDQFVVQDHEHGKAILLNAEDLPLRRYGWIGFSEARLASSDVVQSSCA
jgi:predicted component of type VI protein secretion system